jgi:predicted XRE-type DNA-binding protein
MVFRAHGREGIETMTRARTKSEIRRGGTNVFADLGRPDAENHFVKAQLVSRMMDIMKARNLSQTALADIVGIAQPDVSNLIRGRFRGYSIDRLMSFLVALDQDVEIVVRRKPRGRTDARLTVTAA